MKRRTCIWSIIALTFVRLPAAHDAGREASAVAKPQVVKAYGQLPLSFEANQGQTDQRVKFLSHGSGYSLFLTGDEAVLAMKKPEQSITRDRQLKPAAPSAKTPSAEPLAVVRMRLVGANAAAKVTGLAELPGKSNYFIGNDPKKWRTNVPNYAKVKYTSVYPGVDLVYYGNQRQLEYDFVVQPGADPRQIALQLVAPASTRDAAKAKMAASRIEGNGDLVVATEDGDVIFHKPVVYQPAANNGQWTKEDKQKTTDKHFVGGNYVLKDDRLTFEVASYDKTRPLVIDPTLAYSTYLGGSNFDSGAAIAVDAAGNAYVTGFAQSSDFPTTPGTLQTTFSGVEDAFISKVNAAGSALVYSTYLGGSQSDSGWGIAVDASGNAYAMGYTASSNFPTTAGTFQSTYGGNGDAFVTKLDAAGSVLVYSTYLGGSGAEGVNFLFGHIAVDTSGNAYVTGSTGSSDFPTTIGAFQTSYGGNGDAFVTKLNAAGSALVYSSYLGGSGAENRVINKPGDIAVDASGNVYLTGQTGLILPNNFPITPGAFQPSFGGGAEDAFVCKLNAAGSALLYSTYLGGSGEDDGFGIAVDAFGNAYVTGLTASSNFPTTAGAFQTRNRGLEDAFISKFSLGGAITLTPSSLNFGVQLINTASSPKTVTLTNTGNATLDISSIGISGHSASFSETNNCGSSLLAGASCNIAVTFKPTKTSTCAETGFLDVIDNGSGGAQTVELSGAGTVVSLSVKTLSFGNQPVGTTSVAKTITLTNHATSRAVSVEAIGISGLNSPAFAQTHTCGMSLAAGASCTLSVTFTPHSKGSKTATLNIWNNGGAAALKVSLSGNGT